MGRKRKGDITLDIQPSSDRDPVGPGTTSRASKCANKPACCIGKDSGCPERLASDIVREYVNLLTAGTGYGGTAYKWLSDGPNACFI